MSVEQPASLSERHETIAQRRANILAGPESHPAAYRRALVSEVLERLSPGGAESFVNFGEILEAYTADHPHEATKPPTPAGVIEQPPLSLEDKGPIQAEQSPAEENAAKPKSRL
jgi:hypothetical protein